MYIGRSMMKQYMPMKPVKVWVRADAVTGYFCDFDVYVGKLSDGTMTEVGLGEGVVLQLSERLRGGNYQLLCDNYFITCHLLDTLHQHQLYACGTTRTNRRGFPEALKNVTLERGEHRFCQRGQLVASVWMDKKPVNMLSTLSQADVTHTAHRRQRDGSRLPVQCSDAVCTVQPVHGRGRQGGPTTTVLPGQNQVQEVLQVYLLVFIRCCHHQQLHFIIIHPHIHACHPAKSQSVSLEISRPVGGQLLH